MDDQRRDFSRDLGDIKSSMDVGDILDALNTTKRNATSVGMTRAAPTDHKGTGEIARGPQIIRQTSRRPAARAKPEPSRELPRAGLCNVTTRLSLETNEQLTKAALRQKLKGATPDTRQDILEVAAKEWLRRQGYAKSVAEAGQASLEIDGPADEVADVANE